MLFRRPFAFALFSLLALAFAPLAGVAAIPAAAPAPVTLQPGPDLIVLNNGLVTAELAARSGNLRSFRLGTQELLAEQAYLDWHDGRNHHLSRASLSVIADPAKSPDGRAEVAFIQPWSRDPKHAALDVALHYVLLPGETALRMFAVFRHPADYPAAGFGQSRYVLRVRDELFETISVDEARTRALPPSDTPVEVLGPKESMRFTTGPAQGAITDKYHYFTEAGGHFFHGWMGAKSKLGVWIVYGSTEDANGGPTRQHNTAHWPRVLLKILSCGHYGAPDVNVPAGQAWEKLYGPWMLYANAAPFDSASPAATLAALRSDAARQAAAEQAAFPPAWLQHLACPPLAERGHLSGRLALSDPQAPSQTAARAWVGLVAPPPAPDWQQQSLGYQTWTRADPDGRFSLRAVRPGRYALHAFVDGVLDEFHRADIEIAAGQELALGDLVWTPVRHGRQLWQIGVPDRRASEFRHGDNPRRWGLWLEYPKDFPNDVDFTVGRSDPRTDWNFAQVTRPGEGQRGYVGTIWRVRFEVPAPTASTFPAPSPSPDAQAWLRFAFAGAHNAKLRVLLDGQPLGEKSDLGSDNAVARASDHGQYSTWDLAFPARLLTPGPHVFTLEQRAGGVPFKNVMYDCLRLEAP
jgi:rhamnogalacturonan endolyase